MYISDYIELCNDGDSLDLQLSGLYYPLPLLIIAPQCDVNSWRNHHDCLSSHSTTLTTPTPTPTPTRPTRLHPCRKTHAISLFPWQAERHSRDDPHEDVGEDVCVGFVECELYQTIGRHVQGNSLHIDKWEEKFRG